MRSRLLISVLSLPLCASAATVTTLYNGSLGTTPQSQGYLEYTTFPGLGVTATAGGSTSYSSAASRFEGGGFSNDNTDGSQVNASFPSLDAATGFTVSLSMQELSETHISNNRSGVALIALAASGRGVEISFWNDHVWAQAADFTHAEDASYSTLTANKYDLLIVGAAYVLSANGAAILTGPLAITASANPRCRTPRPIICSSAMTRPRRPARFPSPAYQSPRRNPRL